MSEGRLSELGQSQSTKMAAGLLVPTVTAREAGKGWRGGCLEAQALGLNEGRFRYKGSGTKLPHRELVRSLTFY